MGQRGANVVRGGDGVVRHTPSDTGGDVPEAVLKRRLKEQARRDRILGHPVTAEKQRAAKRAFSKRWYAARKADPAFMEVKRARDRAYMKATYAEKRKDPATVAKMRAACRAYYARKKAARLAENGTRPLGQPDASTSSSSTENG